MKDLSTDAYLDLWKTVRVVQAMLEHHFCGGENSQQQSQMAFNVAVQDGRAAGQSVPHVHVHVLPRKEGDYARNDDIYDDLQQWAPRPELPVTQSLDVPDDDQLRR